MKYEWAIIAGLAVGLGTIVAIHRTREVVALAMMGAVIGGTVEQCTTKLFKDKTEIGITARTLVSYVSGFLLIAITVYKILETLINSFD
ncbi:MAG: hypothetical protein GY861_11185 [bacterium]|nr:hypothetical protein [bacterium]